MLTKRKISYTPYNSGWMLTERKVKNFSYVFPKKKFFHSRTDSDKKIFIPWDDCLLSIE